MPHKYYEHTPVYQKLRYDVWLQGYGSGKTDRSSWANFYPPGDLGLKILKKNKKNTYKY